MLKNWRILKHLFSIELKSFTRSKYLRFSILHNYMLIPLALYILKNKSEESSEVLLVFWTCLLAATPSIGVSAFCFSKDGFFYQSLVTRSIPLKLYVQGKILFIMLYSVLFYLCLSPFIMGCQPIVMYTFGSGALYYIGFGGMLMLYLSSFDKHKVDLNANPFFNYKGFSVIKVLLTLPVMSPLFFWLKTRYWGIGIMFFFGICGLLMFNFFITHIENNLARRKYSLLSIPN